MTSSSNCDVTVRRHSTSSFLAAFVFEMLLHEFYNVERKRRRDVNNRVVRRHLEKMVTDVVRASDVIVRLINPGSC